MDRGPTTVIVRVWWHHPGGFRAEVRPLRGGDSRYFRDSEALRRYLEQLGYLEEREAGGQEREER